MAITAMERAMADIRKAWKKADKERAKAWKNNRFWRAEIIICTEDNAIIVIDRAGNLIESTSLDGHDRQDVFRKVWEEWKNKDD